MDALDKLDRLHDLFAGLENKVPDLLKESFNNIKPVVEDANIEQLQRGERADGSMLPNYSIGSVQRFGKRPGPMTLHDQGDFYRGITLEVHDDGIELVGHDIKTEMLQVRYGDDIIGLQEESKERIENDYLKQEFEDQLKNYFAE